MEAENITHVNFDEWMKLDIRVAKILKVEDIEDADKLYKLTIDVGEEIGERTIIKKCVKYRERNK